MINHQISIPNSQLKPHQFEGIENTLSLKHGFLNRSEMGTGKTLVCIGALNHLSYKIRKVLIVCPNSVKFNWKAEFGFSTLKWNVHVLEGTGNAKEKYLKSCIEEDSKGRSVVITNYESLTRLQKTFGLFSPDLIIADEAHEIKNHKAQKTKSLKAIKAKFRWALTGTPILNYPLDIWSIADWIAPSHFNINFFAFRARYCLIYNGAGFPMIKGWMNQDELKRKINEISWGVTKEEAKLNLPPKSFVQRLIEFSPEEKRVYNQMAREMIAEFGKSEVLAQNAISKMGKLMQLTSGFFMVDGQAIVVGNSKLKELETLLTELEGHKVVIWYHFKEELKQIWGLLAKMKKKFYRLISEDEPAERRKQEDGFKDASEPASIMLASLQIGGVGINLTSASYCIYFSNTFSQLHRLQSQDRLHRIGQVNPVTYYDLIVPGSIDSYILNVLDKKKVMSDKLTSKDLSKIMFDK